MHLAKAASTAHVCFAGILVEFRAVPEAELSSSQRSFWLPVGLSWESPERMVSQLREAACVTADAKISFHALHADTSRSLEALSVLKLLQKGDTVMLGPDRNDSDALVLFGVHPVLDGAAQQPESPEAAGKSRLTGGGLLVGLALRLAQPQFSWSFKFSACLRTCLSSCPHSAACFLPWRSHDVRDRRAPPAPAFLCPRGA